MEMIKKIIAVLSASLMAASFTYAAVSIEKSVTVAATVNSANLDKVPAKLSVVSPAADNEGVVNITFNSGSPLFVGDTDGKGAQNSRYVSEAVVLDYVAPYGPWDIRIYTTRLDLIEGLVDINATDSASRTAAQIAATERIPLKFTTAPRSDPDPDDTVDPSFDIGDNTDWAGGDDALFSFVIQEDVDATDDNGLFFFKLASSSIGDESANSSFEFYFGVDVLGASAGITYSADVTIELYIQ